MLHTLYTAQPCWIVIYPVDRVVHLSNNLGKVKNFYLVPMNKKSDTQLKHFQLFDPTPDALESMQEQTKTVQSWLKFLQLSNFQGSTYLSGNTLFLVKYNLRLGNISNA